MAFDVYLDFLNEPFSASFSFSFCFLKRRKELKLKRDSNLDRKSRSETADHLIATTAPCLFLYLTPSRLDLCAQR